MITSQAYLFCIFTINGVVIGLLFDFFRILRKSFKTKDAITYVQDFIFWMITGAIILYSTFTFNNGEIRLYMFLAILLGAIIYMLFISKFVIKINVAIITFLKDIFAKVFDIVSIPFKLIYRVVKSIFVRPISFITINLKKISTNLFINTQNKIKKSKKV